VTRSTGVGSWPGEDAAAYAEAVRVVLGELDVPYVPELPGRGATATMTGRSLAVLEGLAVDLQPSGWRLVGAGAPGVDHRRTRSLLAQDLDAVEEQAQGWEGPFKTQVAGPLTLAATVEKPRGDRVLSDHGARRDLAESLAEGVRGHVRDLRRRVPAASSLVVQVDEPALAAVLAGQVPTASGFGRHRVVHPPEASALLGGVLSAIAEEGAEPWVHSCAPGVPWDLVRGAGAVGLVLDLSMLSAGDHDTVAEALEAGQTVALGVVPSEEPGGGLTDARVVERVQRWLDMLGLDPSVGSLAVAPTCGLAGASEAWARRATTLSRQVAAALT
jgi:methionine synthase II (cobalamin-independent)